MISDQIVALLKTHLHGCYSECKEILRYQAIRCQALYIRRKLAYYNVAVFGEYFSEHGRKYGFLREFHENGIC